MPNQPHRDKKMVSYRLPLNLIKLYQAEAARRGITDTDLIIYAINLVLSEAKS